MDNATDQVSSTIAEWQKQLLQLDRRNNLLYFNARRSAVLLDEGNPDDFLRRLEAARKGLRFAYAEPRPKDQSGRVGIVLDPSTSDDGLYFRPGDIETDCAPLDLQRRLRALSKRDREWREEQGVNVLFLAVGLLRWVDEEGREDAAPLLLVPCMLERPSVQDPFVLARVPDDVECNVTLAYTLSLLGIHLPEVDGEDPPSQYFADVERLIKDRQGWSVERSMVLSTFQYSKIAMWKDLESLREDGVAHPLVRALAGDQTAAIPELQSGSEVHRADPATLRGGLLDDLLDVRDQLLVLPADYSQVLAVEAARSGQPLVIHGPPGTGKSQTIANIIGALLGDGKKVLFVSEKTAALDVVKRFLDRCGLSSFCLDLHSDRGRKASVYGQLREALEADRRTVESEFDYERLVETRRHLNGVVRALHARRKPLNRSVFEMHGRLAELRGIPDVPFDVSDPLGLTRETFEELRGLAVRVSQRPLEFADHLTSRWGSLRPEAATLRLVDDIRRQTRNLQDTAESLRIDAEAACSWLGIERNGTRGEVARTEALLERLTRAIRVPPQWLEPGDITRLVNIARVQLESRQYHATLREQLSRWLAESQPPLVFRDLAGRLSGVSVAKRALAEAFGPTWETTCVRESPELLLQAERFLTAAAQCILSAGAVAEAMGVSAPSSRAELQRVLWWSRAVAQISPVPATWLDPVALTQIASTVDSAETTLDLLDSAEATLFAEFDDGFLDVVDVPMLVRYRSDYGSLVHRLGGQYRRDQRVLLGLRKSGDKPSIDEAVKGIESALVVKRLRSDWEKVHSELKNSVDRRLRGRSSDWRQIRVVLRTLRELRENMPANPNADAILTDSRAGAAFKDLAQALERDAGILGGAEFSLFGPQDSISPDTAVASRVALTQELLSPLAGLSYVFSTLQPFLRAAPTDLGELSALVDTGARLEAIEAETTKLEESLSADFGEYYSGFGTDWDAIISALEWLQEVLELSPAQSSNAGKRHLLQPEPRSVYDLKLADLQRSSRAFDSRTAELGGTFAIDGMAWQEWNIASFDQIKTWSTDILEHADEAGDWVRYQGLVRELEARTSQSLASRIRIATARADLVPLVIERRLITAWLDAVYATEPALLQFAATDQDGLIADFRRLDQRLPIASQWEIKRRIFSRYPDQFSTVTGAGQVGTLRAQLSRKRRQFAVRRLFRTIPQLLQTLKPCCMMSPLAVSQFLPRSALASETISFDTVIFDEASQIFPQDAVPSLVRAAQVIVVGDEQQLPPTSFFRRAAEDDDEPDDDDAVDGVETNALEGRDSILEVMTGLLDTRVADKSLNVHYRSRHEDLINFSNHHFYRDRLLVFPSPHPADGRLGLLDVFLEDGRYAAGASRTNQREAEEVVRRVFELMRKSPAGESIGVVALSRAQADRIEELIAQARLSAPELNQRFSTDHAEPFFVKNLESVQGDERDHIILSVGYGPTVGSGRVQNRFGPLNSEAGGRRLNVAVTRARRSMTTVHSLRASDIVSEQPGARLLREYLLYIENPEQAFESAVTGDPAAETESPFEEAVRQALVSRGHRVRAQVGVAGYRIDLAVESAHGSGFDLGIECDGWMYHSSPAARDRDWMRQGVLEGLGWHIHRVWSTAWVRNPLAEIRAIEDSLAVARSARALDSAGRHVEISGANASPRDVAPAVEDGGGTERPAPSEPELDDMPQTVEASEAYLFDEYEEASLAGIYHGPELQYETPRHLESMLLAIARAEGPVHFDVAMDRIRASYGMARARQASRDHVLEVLQTRIGSGLALQMRSGRDDLFFWATDGSVVRPRRPRNGGNRRTIFQIAPQELDCAIEAVARVLIGAPREDLTREAARQLGYNRLGPDVQSLLGEAIDRLLAQGRLVETFGMLRPAA